MEFKERLKQQAIVNREKMIDSDALGRLEDLKADGTLDRFYVRLREMLTPTFDDKYLLLKLLKQAMLTETCLIDDKYVLRLKTGSAYRTIFGTVEVKADVPTEMLKVNSIFENAQYAEPLPRKRTQALKGYFEVCKQDNWETFFPRNVITGYLDSKGKLKVSSNIATWTKETIADALQQLKDTENVVGKYDGEEIIFEID